MQSQEQRGAVEEDGQMTSGNTLPFQKEGIPVETERFSSQRR